MSTDFIRGVQAAEAEFLAMYSSPDWSDQCSIGFASTLSQALHVIVDGADTHPPEPMLNMLDRHLREYGGELRVTVDKPTDVWSASIDDDNGLILRTAMGPVSAVEGLLVAVAMRRPRTG